MRPEPSSNIGWLTIGATLVFLLLGACQDAPTAPEKNSTQIVAEITLTKERNAPDSLTWRTTGAAQRATLTGSGLKFKASISLPSPLGNGDSIWIQLWTAGMRTAELRYNQMAGSSTLKYAEIARPDSIALSLLERLLMPAQRNHDTLLAVYAKALVDGDAAFKGYPKNCPTGIDTAALIRIALTYALGKGSKLANLSAAWLLAIDTATVHERIQSLVITGVAKAADTLGMFPPPPLRVKVPVSVASSVQAGGNGVALSGSFEWDKGLGLVAVNSYVVHGADTLKTVSVNGIPAIGSGDIAVSLTGNAQIMAGSAAPVGICSLVVVVRDGNGNAARSATSFEILKGAVVPQTPTIRLLSPIDGKIVPFDTTSIVVKWIATALNSKIDTVQIGDQMGTQESDSVWSARVPLPATGKPIVVTARAHSIQNVWAVQSASFTRSADLAGPNLTWVSPIADTTVESSTTSLVFRFKVQDPSGVDTILVNGQPPDSVTKAGVAWKTVTLGASGTVTLVSVRLVDGAKNAAVAVRSVARKLDYNLAFYGLPDSFVVQEDSSLTHLLRTNCPPGSTCKLVPAVVGDTALLQASILSGTSLLLVPKRDQNGVTSVTVGVASGTEQLSVSLWVFVVPINDAPTLSVIPSLLGSPTGTSIFSNWRASVSPGPSDEVSQRISYLVTVDSGASLVTGTPVVDATGKLSLTGKGISGVTRLSIVAVDNGDSTGLNKNRSTAQYLRVRLDAPPTLKVADTLLGYEDQRTKSDTVHIDDLENLDGLALDWAILDTTILPKANLRVKAVPGGYSFDALTTKDSSGNVRIAWKLTDPVGNVVRDTSVIRFVPVNDAPVIDKAAGLPDTLVISCLTRDTTLPKLFGDIQWEPGVSTQAGTFKIVLADTAQAHLFYSTPGVDGIQSLADGRLHFFLKPDTDLVVELKILAKDDGGVGNGGIDAGARSIWLHLTNSVKDADGNSYAFRHMPDGYIWMQSNLYTKPKNGDTVYSCAGAFPDTFYLAPRKPNCQVSGALYNWQEAMNIQKGCDLAVCRDQVTEPWQGLCPSGWHVASSNEWGRLFAATYISSKNQGDSAYSLKSADEAWQWCRDIPCLSYPGAGKYGNFIVPTGRVAATQAGNGVNFWVPTMPPNFSGPPDWPPTLALDYSIRREYAGLTAETASVRCVRDTP